MGNGYASDFLVELPISGDMEARSYQTVSQGDASVYAALIATFDAFFAHQRDAIALYDVAGHLLSKNASAQRLRRIAQWDEARAMLPARTAFTEVCSGVQAGFEVSVPTTEGPLAAWVDLIPVMTGQHVDAVLEIVRDRHPLQRAQNEVESLPGLPSPEILRDRIERLLLQMRREHASFAVHLLEVTLPQGGGTLLIDELRIVALHRLVGLLRQVDTVAPYGTALLVLQLELFDSDAVPALVKRMAHTLALPVRWQQQEYLPHVRIGSAIATSETLSVDELLRNAEQALVASTRTTQ